MEMKIHARSKIFTVSENKKYSQNQDAQTVYINATCLFGGVDIK